MSAQDASVVEKPVLRALVVVLWAAVLVVAGCQFYAHRHYREPVVLGPGVTQVKKLSDYYAPLKGTVNDCNLYILDSGQPGGTFLIIGGTHPEEPGANLSTLALVENAVVKQGRLIVAIHGNRSASTVTRPGDAYPLFYHLPVEGGVRKFRMGDRWANPLDSWPDPEVYAHYPSRQMLAYMDVRNFNRTWPGRPNGLITERTCYAFGRVMKAENVSALFDLHEAELEYPVISTIVAHQSAAPIAAMVSMMLTAEAFPIGMEYSPKALHGLSHREIGDFYGVPVFQPEAPEPFLDRVRGATNEALLLTGRDEFVQKAGEHKLLYEKIDERGWPIEVRVGRHVTTIAKTLEVWSQFNPDKAVVVEGLPTYAEWIAKGVGHFLRNPANVPGDRVAYE